MNLVLGTRGGIKKKKIQKKNKGSKRTCGEGNHPGAKKKKTEVILLDRDERRERNSWTKISKHGSCTDFARDLSGHCAKVKEKKRGK